MKKDMLSNDNLKNGFIAALSMPVGSSKNLHQTTILANGIIAKSYNHQQVHQSRSKGPYRTSLHDIIHELNTGLIEKVSDTCIFPHLRQSTKSVTFMTAKHKIWINQIDKKAFKLISNRFRYYSDYYQTQAYSTLPNILGLIRLSEDTSPSETKQYFIAYQQLYPYLTHHSIKYFLFNDDSKCMYWNTKVNNTRPPSSSLAFPVSYDYQPFKNADNDFWLNIDDDGKELIWNQSQKDLEVLKSMGLTNYTFLIIGTERDKTVGSLFLPGEVFGRDLDEGISVDRKETLQARHDIPNLENFVKHLSDRTQSTTDSVTSVHGSTLLPVCKVKDDDTEIEYYFCFVDTASNTRRKSSSMVSRVSKLFDSPAAYSRRMGFILENLVLRIY